MIIDINTDDLYFRWTGIRVNGKAMVLDGDIDLASAAIFNRLVSTTVSEFKFIGPGAQGQGENLMAQTDTHKGERP